MNHGPPKSDRMARPTLILLLALASAITPAQAQEPPRSENPLDAERAYSYLNRICDLGPRISGSAGMKKQRQLLIEHFEQLESFQQSDGQVLTQSFLAPNPQGKSKVRMTNLVVRWQPKIKTRVLLCAHYDTRPLPDRDPNPRARRSGRFIGANDGGSGVALLMELGHHMADLDGPIGIDFVFFDGEELVYDDDRDPYFLGSRWFARQYKAGKLNGTYQAGVLLDMVGDADLQIYQERHSWRWRDVRPLVNELWGTAAKLGIEEFVPRVKYEIRDDHLPLHAAGIPICDVIDFDYPAWHTEADTPRQCSGASLAKVGWVMHEWLRMTQQKANQQKAAAKTPNNQPAEAIP